jgi:hypothetical protein
MDGLTPASADDLPPLGELVADDPFWRYPAGMAREGVAHLRVWTTVTDPPGHLAVVTETGPGGSVTESAGLIWAARGRAGGCSSGKASEMHTAWALSASSSSRAEVAPRHSNPSPLIRN